MLLGSYMFGFVAQFLRAGRLGRLMAWNCSNPEKQMLGQELGIAESIEAGVERVV